MAVILYFTKFSSKSRKEERSDHRINKYKRAKTLLFVAHYADFISDGLPRADKSIFVQNPRRSYERKAFIYKHRCYVFDRDTTAFCLSTG